MTTRSYDETISMVSFDFFEEGYEIIINPEDIQHEFFTSAIKNIGYPCGIDVTIPQKYSPIPMVPDIGYDIIRYDKQKMILYLKTVQLSDHIRYMNHINLPKYFKCYTCKQAPNKTWSYPLFCCHCSVCGIDFCRKCYITLDTVLQEEIKEKDDDGATTKIEKWQRLAHCKKFHNLIKYYGVETLGCDICNTSPIPGIVVYSSADALKELRNNTFDVCHMCYSSKIMKEKVDEAKKKYNLIKVPQVPFMLNHKANFGSLCDWVPLYEFKKTESVILLNCNPESVHHRKIGARIVHDFAYLGYFILSKSLHDILSILISGVDRNFITDDASFNKNKKYDLVTTLIREDGYVGDFSVSLLEDSNESDSEDEQQINL
jgi:hypothetical protein